MSTLSPKERALIDEARKGWAPGADVARSARAGIAARLRADPSFGLDAPGPATASRTSLGAPRSLLQSPLGVLTGIAVAGVCVFFLARAPGDRGPAPGAVVTSPSAAAAPSSGLAPRAEASAPEIGTISPDSLPSAVGTASTPAPSSRAPTFDKPTVPAAASGSAIAPSTDAIAEEVALVGSAQRSLRDGSPDEALRSLSNHATRFPTGALREERIALQVLALCALGDLAKARVVRADLERLAPASSHLQRLGCAAP